MLVGAILSCAHETAKTTASSRVTADPMATREPASISDNEAREKAFLSLMADEADPKALRSNYLDRILKIYYRAEI